MDAQTFSPFIAGPLLYTEIERYAETHNSLTTADSASALSLSAQCNNRKGQVAGALCHAVGDNGPRVVARPDFERQLQVRHGFEMRNTPRVSRLRVMLTGPSAKFYIERQLRRHGSTLWWTNKSTRSERKKILRANAHSVSRRKRISLRLESQTSIKRIK